MTMSVMFAFGWCNLIGHGDAMQIRMQIADDTVGLTAQNVYYTAQLSVINCPKSNAVNAARASLS